MSDATPVARHRADAIRSAAWLLAALLLVASIAVNWRLRSQERVLNQQLSALRHQFSNQQRRQEQLGELVQQIGFIKKQQGAEKKQLFKLLKFVKTRDEFPITEGEKIAWRLVTFSPRGERRLCFYVPRGKHRLVYSFWQLSGEPAKAMELSPSGSYRLKYSGSTDHRLLPQTASVELEEHTVYEFSTSLEQTECKTVNFRLRGKEDEIVHEYSETLVNPAIQSGLTNLQNDSSVFMSYPNELRTLGEAMQHIRDKKSSPITPLLTLTVDQLDEQRSGSQGRVLMRVWIDSDSPPCMSDVEVLGRYRFVSQLKSSWPPELRVVKAFEQTFQPYNGTGRYYFRDGYFQTAGER